jgi:hypothetical protein
MVDGRALATAGRWTGVFHLSVIHFAGPPKSLTALTAAAAAPGEPWAAKMGPRPDGVHGRSRRLAAKSFPEALALIVTGGAAQSSADGGARRRLAPVEPIETVGWDGDALKHSLAYGRGAEACRSASRRPPACRADDRGRFNALDEL